MAKMKTDAEYRAKLKKERPDIIPLEIYKGNHTKIKVKNTKCMHEYLMTPHSLFSGCGCPECASNHLISPHKMALKITKEFDGKLSLYEDTHINTNSKSKLHCNDCGYDFWARINALLRNKKRAKGNNTGCPKCSHTITPSADELQEELNLRYNFAFSFDKNELKTMSQKLAIHCTVCGKEFMCTLSRLLGKKKLRCPICSLHSMETPVFDALSKKHVLFKHDVALEGSNFKESKYPLRADFRFDKYPLIIETDGKQHFSDGIGGKNEYIYTKERDMHKNKWCKEHGYILIRVTSSPTKEWGTERHITLSELLHLIEIGIDEHGNVNLDVFKPYDFNRE